MKPWPDTEPAGQVKVDLPPYLTLRPGAFVAARKIPGMGPSAWRAECACGWKGDWKDTGQVVGHGHLTAGMKRLAKLDGLRHVTQAHQGFLTLPEES